jgi:hypothetical protein
MTTQHLKIVATGLPESLEQYQLALDAAFAGGVAYGQAKQEISAPEIKWTSVDECLPEPGMWLVTVDTDDKPEVHVLELNRKQQWIHEGEPTFCHGYYFRPTHWAPTPAPAVIEKDEE